MYCGSNKKARSSQQQIAGAMMALIQQKPYAQISVSELCREAGVSRQTFYSLFSSRENVVTFALEEQYGCVPEPEARSDSLEALCQGCSEYIRRNSAFIKLLAENNIDHLLYDSIFNALERCDRFLKDAPACARRCAVSFYAGGLSHVARQYAREGCAATTDELTRMLLALFRGELL